VVDAMLKQIIQVFTSVLAAGEKQGSSMVIVG